MARSLLTSRRRALLAIGAVLALASAALTGGIITGDITNAGAATAPSARPVTAGSRYLALGDSVPFGYREPANLPTPDYPQAASFVGYPEDVAAALGLHVANASCPGETSDSFIRPGVQSNGCENSPGSPVGYRTVFPLHERYSGTQLAYALRYLTAHPDTRLVTLMIGANDGFLCQETTADQCLSELPAVLARVKANVATILAALRDRAHYRGQIVIVNYYSLDYSSAIQNASSAAVNAAMDAGAQPYRVAIADGFGAFKTAAAQAGGNSCTAGLLTTLTTGGCGVHPSVAGQALLALAVARAVQH